MPVMRCTRLWNFTDELGDRCAMSLIADQYLEEAVRHCFLFAFIHTLHAIRN